MFAPTPGRRDTRNRPAARPALPRQRNNFECALETIADLGGIELEVDRWGIDVCFSGTQKCLSVPPGLAPITFSDRAADLIARRQTPVPSWYFDVAAIRDYWDGGATRAYHHTAPVSMIYALHRGLQLVIEEGLENRWARHLDVGDFFQNEIVNLGFDLFAEDGYRLPQLTSIRLPQHLDDSARERLLLDHDIEIGGGLGELAGSVWRVGLMGFGAKRQNAIKVLQAIRALL